MRRMVFLFWVFFATAAYAKGNHCQPQEEVVFYCQLGKGKTVSVCAAKPLTAPLVYLQYRFGPKNVPELLLSIPASQFTQAVSAGTLMYSGGGGAYLRFFKGEYRYTVYTGIGKGWNKEGVAVHKKGKSVANLLCHDLAVSKLGSDFFQKAGIAEDKEGFEIP